MASVSISANGPISAPYIYSTATVSEKSRNGTSVVLDITIRSSLQYAQSYIGSGYLVRGTVTAYGETKTVTIKESSSTWSGNAERTNTTTLNLTVPASVNSISIGYKCTVSGLDSGTATGTSKSLSLSKVLASTVSVTSFTDETNPTITFSNPSDFKVRPYINFWTSNGGTFLTGIEAAEIPSTGSKITSPYTFELTEAQRNKIRNAYGSRTTGYATIGVQTFSGSTALGTSSKGATFTNNIANPIFTDFEYEDVNTTTTSLTGDNSKLILGYSTLRITINDNNVPEAQKGATMSYYVINNTQYPYSDNFSVDIEKWGNKDVSVTAVDSRGISTQVTKTATIGQYTDLIKRNSSLIRTGNVSEETKLSFDGEMQYRLPNGNLNTLSVTYKYKKTTDTTYINGTTTITPTITDDGVFRYEGFIKGDLVTGFDIDESYDVIVKVQDVLSEIEYKFILNSGIPAIAVKGNNIAIHGGYDETLGGTQLNGNTYLDECLLRKLYTGKTAVVSVPGNSYVDTDIDYTDAHFVNKPNIIATLEGNSTGISNGGTIVNVLRSSVTTTGAKLRYYNYTTTTANMYINWIAIE